MSQSEQNSAKQVYDLFINKKFKSLVHLIKTDLSLLYKHIHDNKTIVQFIVQTNNIKLFKKLLDIDQNIILQINYDNHLLPHYAINAGFIDLFFYLVDLLVGTKYVNHLFQTKIMESINQTLLNQSYAYTLDILNETNTNNKLHQQMITQYNKIQQHPTSNNLTLHVIFKKDFDLVKTFIQKYYMHIDWTNHNNIDIVYYMVNLFYYKIDEIIELIKLIQQTKTTPESKHSLNTFIFKNPIEDNSLFYLIYAYYEPNLIKNRDIIPSNSNNEKTKQFRSIFNSNIKKYILLHPEQINYTNQIEQSIIYYITKANDIEMLDFCIKNGANLNHTSPFGYNNYCKHLLSYGNPLTIQHVLESNTDIDFNYINLNNETPIYSLLRNTHFAVQKDLNTSSNQLIIKIISDVLTKTTNWDLQNIYGKSVIHLLVDRHDIEQYYPVLQSKYFNINLQDKEGTTPLSRIHVNFSSMYSDEKKITELVNNFANIVVDTYIHAINETNTNDENILNLKKICNKYDKSNVKSECFISAKNTIMNTQYSDLDKITDDYLKLTLIDHQFANYNLYNARDVDIYYYYLFLINKYDILGFPLNINFDKSKAFELGKLNALPDLKPQTNTDTDTILDEPNDPSDLSSSLEYLKSYINNTIKYQMLYPLNIYWINKHNYLIPHNFVDSVLNSIRHGKKIIICRINFIGHGLHANLLLIDTYNKRILRFEPQGGVNVDDQYILDEFIETTLKTDDYFKNYKYLKPAEYMPLNGFQSLSQESNFVFVRKGDIGGFCVAWCLWWVELYINNLSNNLFKKNRIKTLIPKVIKKIINSDYFLIEYIRNYANYMHNKLLKKISRYISISDFYYEKITQPELQLLYKIANSQLENY